MFANTVGMQDAWKHAPPPALVRTDVGSVLVQSDVCNGCGYFVVSCPFGVVDKRHPDGSEYAVVNLRSVSPGQDGWFHAVTTFGEGALKVNAVKELGVFDHVWKDPQATWQVFSRVVPKSEGATVMMTLFQPAVMSDQRFDEAMKQMEIEMKKLKEILER